MCKEGRGAGNGGASTEIAVIMRGEGRAESGQVSNEGSPALDMKPGASI